MNRRSFLLSTVSLAALPIAGLPFRAAAAATAATENTLTLEDASGGGARNYPMRIGRPFVQGEIPSVPHAIVNGTPVPTQADVKGRWPDGSVRQAVLSFIVPNIPSGGKVTVAFANQDAAASEALTKEAMLDPNFNFEAVMQVTRDGKIENASARQMLQNGDYTVWCKGPIATTVILADHSPARKYDIGFEAIRPLRPIFHATFWPSLHKVQVRAIGEIVCTEAMQDILYGLVLKSGLAESTDVFRQEGVTHWAGTRWTRTCWIGGEPEPKINIDHNIGYLAKTFAFPNFDASLKIPEKEIALTYRKWLLRGRNLYEGGGWVQSMGSTGGRPDIGPYTGQVSLWLLSGDYRLFEMISEMANLAGAWAMHAREGNPAKRYDRNGQTPAIGRPVSVYARPTLWLFDDRDGNQPGDAVVIHGPRVTAGKRARPWGSWIVDGAHQPDPYSALYTLTGDYFALEQLQFWAARFIVGVNPRYKGPAPSGVIIGQTRGDAWMLRNRVHAAYLSPDQSPEKAYFTAMVDDPVAYWEGQHGIRGTRFEGTPLWNFAFQKGPYESPLHIWNEHPGALEGKINKDMVSGAELPWQCSYVMFELGRSKEKGYPTGALLSYLGYMLTSQFREPKTYNFFNVQRYRTAVRDKAGNFFKTWTDTLAADLGPPLTAIRGGACDGYGSYAYGASTMLVKEPGGAEAYAWLRDNIYLPRRAQFAACPKWAFVPRSA